MKIIKRIHPGYKEFEKAKKENIKIPCMFGKYQYMYSSDKGKISLIFLKNRAIRFIIGILSSLSSINFVILNSF